ncbi:hypothetical protein DXM27_01215 [Rhizobium rhizogenes]|uniref:Uncharacterized protein n=1 Tax=Rhizobium rhizogenes TaxID=359 RepID=A0AA88F354_RHIRH|nr:hypothetical protein DXM27_01215 [Rhizobium rhizogenes]
MEKDDVHLRLMHGGPFRKLMVLVGLGRLRRRAFVFAWFCWGLPLVALLLTHGADGIESFLTDWGAWTKFLLAPVLLTLAEKPIGFIIDECVVTLFRIPLIASRSMAEGKAAMAAARKSTAATFPELACLAVAVGASLINLTSFLSGRAPLWAMYGEGLSFPGLWCLAVGNTLYWFLMTRLLWKNLIWSRFLSDVAKCRLRLAVTHPDGHGGLGFLGYYPAAYGLFTLAVSSVVAAGVGHVMQRQAVTPALFTAVCVAWLAIVVIYFALPLVPVARQLSRLKRDTITLSLAKALEFERWNERKTLGTNVFEDDGETEPEAGDIHDMKPLYGASLKTSAHLFNKRNALPVFVPALAPLLVTGASFLPYAELGTIVKRLLFL